MVASVPSYASSPKSWFKEDFPSYHVKRITQNNLSYEVKASSSTKSKEIYQIGLTKGLQVVATISRQKRIYTVLINGQVDSSLVREQQAGGNWIETVLSRQQSERLMKKYAVIQKNLLRKHSAPIEARANFIILMPLVWGLGSAAFGYVVLKQRSFEEIAQNFAIGAVGSGLLGASAKIAAGLGKVAQATKAGGLALSAAERIKSARVIVSLADKYNRAKTLAINKVVDVPAIKFSGKVAEICDSSRAVFTGFWCAHFQKKFTEESLRSFGEKAISEVSKFSTTTFANWAWEKITGNSCTSWWDGGGMGKAAIDYGRMSLGAFCTGIIPASLFQGPAWAKDVEPSRRMTLTVDPHLKEVFSELLPQFTSDMREGGRPVSVVMYSGGNLDTPIQDAAGGRVDMGVSWRNPKLQDPGGMWAYKGANPHYDPACSKPPICTGVMWLWSRGKPGSGPADLIDWLRNSQSASNILWNNDFESLYKEVGSYTLNHYIKFTVDKHLHPWFVSLAQRYATTRRLAGQPVRFRVYKTDNQDTPLDDSAHGRVDFGVMWRQIRESDPGGIAWYRAATWNLAPLCTPKCVDQFWFTARGDSIMPAGLEFINWIRTQEAAQTILSPKWTQIGSPIGSG